MRSFAAIAFAAALAWLAGPAAAQTADWPVTEGARRRPLLAAHRHHARERVAAAGRVDLPPRRLLGGQLPAARVPRQRLRVDADRRRRPAVLHDAAQPRDRARTPETGTELWTFDPQLERGLAYGNLWINRGVSSWHDAEAVGGACARRVFLATLDARLFALDAATGKPCPDFGAGGSVDLRVGIAPIYDEEEYTVTSPGTVVGDVIVVGSAIPDTLRPDSPPGDVRAFDVRSGALRWTFHTIPHPGEPGYETWETGTKLTGAANVWSTITADLRRGWVFLPVSTPSPDYYGGDRPGANLYSDSVVALDARTGERKWHFQTVHHDLWDYDLASPPVLVTLERDGRAVDAVAQPTKQGFVFVLDRETGASLFPVEQRPVPASDVPGERTSPTQPFPLAPPPLVPQRLDADSLYAPTPAHLEACRARLAGLRNDGMFTPPTLHGSIAYPFSAGGANWSGATWDPARQLLVVPVQNLVQVIRLDEVADRATGGGADLKPLRGFAWNLLWWLWTGRGTGDRYRISQLSGRVLFEHDGVPCNRPPWAMLVGVDLARGTIAWTAPTSVDASDPGGRSLGPALSTASGLVFHSGTQRPVLRVHDADTGARIATFPLPAGLHAGPISYKLRPDGKQFVVIAPGGHLRMPSPLGDYVIAYTLPD